MNVLRVIHPYQHLGTWVFDDETVGLVREPFIAGADTIITHMVKQIPDAEQGFQLVFSDQAFPGYQLELDRQEEEFHGTWYLCQTLDMRGWLCPALLKYFGAPPLKLYAQFRGKTPG